MQLYYDGGTANQMSGGKLHEDVHCAELGPTKELATALHN